MELTKASKALQEQGPLHALAKPLYGLIRLFWTVVDADGRKKQRTPR